MANHYEQQTGKPFPKDSASNRFKTPFNENQAQIKEQIIIITIEGTILNGDQEIPNTSVFLNIIKKETNFKIIYLGCMDAKEMKGIRKIINCYNFPIGRILLNKTSMGKKHYKNHLANLKEKYEIRCLITSNYGVAKHSRLLGIHIIDVVENVEWDFTVRKRIIGRVWQSGII